MSTRPMSTRPKSTGQRATASPDQTASPTPGLSPSPQVTQPAGNQAVAADAGLAPGGDMDTSLGGPFAALLLDVLPLTEAVTAGLSHAANPAVRDWLLALDPASVAAALGDRPGVIGRVLDRLLPAGTGLTGQSTLAGALVGGAEVAGQATLWHQGGGQLEVGTQPRLRLDQGAGLGGAMTDPFGGGVTAKAGVDAGVDVQVEVEAGATLSWAEWSQAFGLGAGELWRRCVLGDAPALGPDGAGVAPLLSADFSASVATGAQATATLQCDDLESVPRPLRDLLDGLAVGAASWSALAELGGGVELSVSAFDGSWWCARLSGEGEALASAAGAASIAAPGLDTAAWAGATAAAAGAGCAIELTVETGAQPDAPSMLVGATFALTSSTGQGGSGRADTVQFDSLAAAWAGLSGRDPAGGGALSADLAAGAPPSVAVAVDQALDPARLAHELPGWFAGIPGAESLLDAGHHGLTSSCAQLALEGTATVSSDDLASAAQAGLTVPDGSSRAGAWRAAADAILHRRLGGVVPAWAGGQEAAIDAAADRVAGFDAVRLRGFVGVGAGGTLSGAAVGRVSGTAQVATRIEIDRPASDADRATLRRVVVGP